MIGKSNQDIIECNANSDSIIVTIKQKNTEQPSYLFCTRIYYMHDRRFHEMFGKTFDHHLMFCNGKKLIFKVWLPNSEKDKKFKNVKEALKSVGMEVRI
jgi:hypothetical protein